MNGSPQPTLVCDAIAECLLAHEVDRVFLLTGGDLSLFRSLRNAGIELCLARTEQASVAMADAYARFTGRVAVVYGQWGPGAANVAGALPDAQWAGSPLLALTSNVATMLAQRFDYQEVDQRPLFGPVTKWQGAADRPERVVELLSQGLRLATRGAPGPVHVDVPADVIRSPLPAPATITQPPRVEPPGPTAAGVARIAEGLRNAESPVVLAGGGQRNAGDATALLRLAELASVPVATTMGGKGTIDETHPLAVGVAGRYSRRVANEILRDADFALVLGSDLGALATDTYRLPGPSATIVQVDIDPHQIGRTMPVAEGVVADAGATCLALIEALEPGPAIDHAGWLADIRRRCDEWETQFSAVANRSAEGHVRPETVAQILREVARPDDVVVADTGFAGAWAGALFPVQKPGRTFTRAAGTLGWAFPAVLGAQLARPDVSVFGLIGDGGFGYNVGDIETAVRLGINAVTIVLNNASLAYEHVAYKVGLGGDIVTPVCDFSDTDFSAVARAFGAWGCRVNDPAGLRAALVDAVGSGQPAVIDVVVSKERIAPVTTFDAVIEREL